MSATEGGPVTAPDRPGTPDGPGTPQTPGQAAYEAYANKVIELDYDRRAYPVWDEKGNIEMCGWEAAAKAGHAAIAAAAPAPDLAAELAMLRADLADYEAQLAKWPRCPAGCNCRIGLPDDADANECGCDGPCNGGAAPAPAGEACPIEAVLPDGHHPCKLPRGHSFGHDFADEGTWGPQAAPARQALEEAVEHAIHVTPAGSGTSAVMRAVDAYVFARSREAPGLARAETAAVRAAAANTARELAEVTKERDALRELVASGEPLSVTPADDVKAAPELAAAMAETRLLRELVAEICDLLVSQKYPPAKVAPWRKRAGLPS